ncbi:MAG: OmpA/MotB domain protein [Bacteroidetes bacterium]|nr:OmpA/MotB domain protein [Bacteroidota bacterium]
MRIFFFFCFCTQLVVAQTHNVFPSKKYVKVIGYTFNKEFDGKMEYDESVIDPKTKKLIKNVDSVKYKLSPAQADTLLMILNDKSTFREGESGCFFPHHAFVFYDAANKPVAYVNICFNCQQIYSAPQYSTANFGGLSEKGDEALFLFCHNLGMPSPRHVKTMQDKDFEVGDIIKIPEIIYNMNNGQILNADSLKIVGQFLSSHPELMVELGVYTGSWGSTNANKKLSESRASSCLYYFTEAKIAPGRIVAKGYGESQLLIPDTELNKAVTREEQVKIYLINCRTELMVFKVR